jgi:hypothetical protein
MEKTTTNAEKIGRLRDELKLKSHMFNKEVQDQWQNLEQKWAKFTKDVEKVKTVAGKSSEEIGAATQLLVEEIEDGYEDIKKTISNKKKEIKDS